MVLIAILIAAAVDQSAPRVIESEVFGLDREETTLAELVERPRELTDEVFARRLIDASGVEPWNDTIMSDPAARGRMGSQMAVSGAGAQVLVYFLGGESRTRRRVCRIRRDRSGMTDALTNAQDWCAAKLGLPPLERLPPIVSTRVERPQD